MAELVFCARLPAADPDARPVTILGKLADLKKVPFPAVEPFLAPRVSETVWRQGVGSLSVSGSSACSLWLERASVAGVDGRSSHHNTPSCGHALTTLVKKEAKEGATTAIIVVCEHSNVLASAAAVARAFPLFSHKTRSTSPRQTVSISFLVVAADHAPFDHAPLTEEEIKCVTAVSEGVRLSQRIVDTPPNEMHTDGFLEEVQAVARKLGVEPLVVRGKELEERGFGGIYGVGKAAAHPPALAVLSHTPPGATKTICWVGKGIVYDTGGLSMKTKLTMPGMKRDCGGAAAMLGAFLATVSLGFSENLHVVLCLAENAVGPEATRPDDIHTLYSGRTVEVNNTDAEGRLVLGDGVAFSRKDLKADWVVDMATLTGAQGISTGIYHAALLSNQEACEKAFFEAGRASGDLVFPLPYTPELHFKEFHSEFADMKNSVMNRSNAQSSCAGLFIGAHLGFDFPGPWVHIDMASPVHSGERATGYGVALLATAFGHLSHNSLLRGAAPAW